MPAHPGPPLWLTASMYTMLFLAGLYPVTVFGGKPYFPRPWESPMRPGALPLVPLTRFPGFVWLIAMGLALPCSIERTLPSAARAENAT